MTGLYFKLHGTHRPNSMKKTVIKRRKRVPAAPGVGGGNLSGRMSDQAAAEALVAVGRAGGSPGGSGVNDDTDAEADQPRKKRTRRNNVRPSRVDKDGDEPMEDEEEEPTRDIKKRRAGPNGWTDSGRSASPNRAPSRAQQVFAFPHPHGFELPPHMMPTPAFLGTTSASAPSSYIRSGSNAPSRTHSPLGPAGSAPGAGYAVGPPPPQHYYPAAPAASPPSEMSSLMVAAGVALGGLGIPSYMDLERHYFELADQKRRWEDMMERTDRLMAGMKRTLDEMRGLAAAAQQQHSSSPPHAQPQALQPAGSQQPSPQLAAASVPAAPAVPLNKGGAAGEPRERASIWPVTEASTAAATRD
ncbi:hypothetical protein D9619_013425 [Psilocybe cf. subviscida]|uniref:GATA-type domain-containing protein n=1 Tax=Psilocybe cf. subviscida TaxID=2480587 RepID=A0A8H5BRJ0_9AGAR|nr:hypothetical protein D9619_013425 [Psilocybe cf. subviscida]